ncbi:MAG: hypothetical protein JKY37_10425 [Nannocystaceae bacterium]|nr:hypothetical protein [Nannocystaceae bacterium]
MSATTLGGAQRGAYRYATGVDVPSCRGLFDKLEDLQVVHAQLDREIV